MPKSEKSTKKPSKKGSNGAASQVQPVAPVELVEMPPVTVTEQSTPPDTPHYKYPVLEIREFSTTSSHGPLTVEQMKLDLLEWETEEQFCSRMVKEQPDTKPEQWLFHDTYHCTDRAGNKVRCHANIGNRPFDKKWCLAIMHMILNGQWAGPLMFPGETINGETIRIGRSGRVLSGQHQMTAAILADEWLQDSRSKTGNILDPAYPAWNGHEHVVLETIVITGTSESEKILPTIDYVRPRSIADVLYTMPLFRDGRPAQRRELTRMLGAALGFLWVRTRALGYQTHPEMLGFLERHPKILKCVEHLYEQNAHAKDGGRVISKLDLNVGICAALCYLMGCAGPGTNGDDYRNPEDKSAPTEKGLDWSLWNHAKKFWALLGRDRAFIPVQMVLNRLSHSDPDSTDNQGQGGNLLEQLVILDRAWLRWKRRLLDTSDDDTPLFIEADSQRGGILYLRYSEYSVKGSELPEGKLRLVDEADFGGIDWPQTTNKKEAVTDTMPPPPSEEEIAQFYEEQENKRRQ